MAYIISYMLNASTIKLYSAYKMALVKWHCAQADSQLFAKRRPVVSSDAADFSTSAIVKTKPCRNLTTVKAWDSQ
eukprot:6472950-Amphidinium_carterae.2